MITLNPQFINKLLVKFIPIIGSTALLLFILGIYFALWRSPADYQQGDTVRIMYVHVPAAWMSLGIYSLIALCSLGYLIWTLPIFDIIARASSEIGAGFTLITLITGSLWGKPIWGCWWVWDARLTSVLILFFLYLGYISLVNLLGEKTYSKAPAILALVGFINIPIIKFSVDMWNSLHQPASIIRSGGPSIHSSMMLPLMIMFAAYSGYFLFFLSLRINSILAKYKIRRILSEDMSNF